jgi:hypothetical protein
VLRADIGRRGERGLEHKVGRPLWSRGWPGSRCRQSPGRPH